MNINSLKTPSLRPYQIGAANYLASRKGPSARALVICPAGGGKTIIGSAALAAVQSVSPCIRIGWACNTREQVEQGRAALDRCKVRSEWVACVAGLTPAHVGNLDVLVIDECHHLMANSWLSIAAACRGAIWGLTATPLTGDEDRDSAFRAFWGGRAHVVDREKVMQGGHLAAGQVRIVDLDTPKEFDHDLGAVAAAEVAFACKKWPGMAKRRDWLDDQKSRALWRATVAHLIGSTRRNSEIIRIALSEIEQGQSVLILVSEIDHGKHLAESITGAVVAYSGMGIKRRREAIAAFRDGALRCLISTSLADEGLDVPRASVLILAAAGRSAAKLEQRSGRVMRPSEGKGVGLVYDFADAGAAMARAQHFARLKTYQSLGYAVLD